MSVSEFTSETRRLAGTEMEHGSVAVHLGPTGEPYTDANITQAALKYLDSAVARTGTAGAFLSTGDRLYPDLNHHLEFSTAECLTFREVIEREFYGGRLILDALRRAVEDKRLVDFRLRKIVSNDHYYWGYHENYLTPRTDENGREYIEALAVHLATRQVFAGSGDLKGDGRYLVSQKMPSIRSLFYGNADQVSSRPLVDQRDEPHANAELYRRQHVTVGDPHLMKYPGWLQMLATSVLMRMVEGGEELSDLYLLDPVKSAQAISADTDLTSKHDMSLSNKRRTALEIQQELAERAYQFSLKNPLPPEEVVGIAEWRDVTQDLAIEPEACDDRVEWIAKQKLLDGLREKRGPKWKQEHSYAAAQNWTLLDPDTGFGLRTEDLRRPIPFGTDTLDLSNPPLDTRANARGRLIGAIDPLSKQDGSIVPITLSGVDWELATVSIRSPRSSSKIHMDDPYQSVYDEVEEVIADAKAA